VAGTGKVYSWTQPLPFVPPPRVPDPAQVLRALASARSANWSLPSALDDLVRRGDPAAARLAQVWTRLTGLLVVHTRAEEEICFPLVSGTGPRALALAEAAIADHHDIRETVAEAELLKAGSLRWCQVVTAARTACAGHFADEERELLGYVCRSMPPETSKALVRQWASFAAAQAAGAGVRPGGIRAGRRERPKRPGPRRRTG
jgi:hypothetical protein